MKDNGVPRHVYSVELRFAFEAHLRRMFVSVGAVSACEQALDKMAKASLEFGTFWGEMRNGG